MLEVRPASLICVVLVITLVDQVGCYQSLRLKSDIRRPPSVSGGTLLQDEAFPLRVNLAHELPARCKQPPNGSALVLQCTGSTTGLGNATSVNLPLTNLPTSGVQVNINFTVDALLDQQSQPCTENCTAGPGTRLQVELGFGTTETPCAGPNGETPASLNTTVAASLLCFPKASATDLAVSVLTNQGMDYNVNVWLETHDIAQGTVTTKYGGKKGAATILAFNLTDEQPGLLERVRLKVESRGDWSGYHGINNQKRFWGPEQVKYLNEMVQTYLSSDEHVTEIPPETSAFFFHESSECILPVIQRGGCANPDEVANCFSETHTGFGHEAEPRLAHHLAFIDSAELTLSSGSVPPRQPGRWFVLLTCATHGWTNHSIGKRGAGCPETKISLEWGAEAGSRGKLWRGFLLMLFAPSILLLGSSLAYFLLTVFTSSALQSSELGAHLPALMPWMIWRALRLVASRCWSVFTDPPPRFAALLVLLASVFCTTALQFVITHWALTLQTADRNVCFYNYSCYYPAFGADLPVNNMLSHVAYFLAGIHIYIQTVTTEFRVLLLADEGVQPIDVSVFQALAVAVVCEGIGSMSYHLCPSVTTFQFDTAFMLPIAHISMFALEDWRWDPDQQGDTGGSIGEAEEEEKRRNQTRNTDLSAPFRYFLYIMNPIWFFNFVGTWYDMNSMVKWLLYCILVSVVALWTFCVLGVLWAFLGIDFESYVGRFGQVFMQALVSLVLSSILMLDVVRDELGGTANIFLLFSALATGVVVLSQWIRKDLIYSIRSIHSFSGVVRVILENMPMVAFIAAAIIALEFFQEKTASVSPTVSPAMSREKNEQCTFASVFDNHDVWHFLSAIALTYWVVALLHIKVRIHLRQFSRPAYMSQLDSMKTQRQGSERTSSGSG